jgi:tetratricopeptide (TPR) repeat protein
MNKKVIFIGLTVSSILLAACSNTPPQAANTNAANSAVVARADNNSPLIATSHSTQQANASSSAAGAAKPNSPMATGQGQAIDTTALDAAVAKAEKEFKAKSKDEKAKQALVDAYAERAFALTEAAQYRSALGDFRRALKLDPNNKAAKDMHDQILNIFKSLNREPPKEGEEPPPLPFKKDA